MKKETILNVLRIQAKQYDKLLFDHKNKKRRIYQILSMLMVDGKLKDEVYCNEFHKNNFSNVQKHCERNAFNSYEGESKNIVIFVTVIPCIQCYNELKMEDNQNITIYYLCESHLDNKTTAKGNKRIIPMSNFFNPDDDEYEEFNRLKGKLLSGYEKWKRNNALRKGGD